MYWLNQNQIFIRIYDDHQLNFANKKEKSLVQKSVNWQNTKKN